MSATDGPVLVVPFMGAGAEWLRYVHPALTPPVSWMGGKRDLAHHALDLLGLVAGANGPAVLGDLSWWGWLWPVVLDAVEGPRVSACLRSWSGQDARALWSGLRDMGPIVDDVAAAAAQMLWLQARAASGVPVWWSGGGTWRRAGGGWSWCAGSDEPQLQVAPGDGRATQRAYERGLVKGRTAAGVPEPAWQTGGQLVSMDGHGRGPYAAWQATCQPKLLASDGRGVERESGQRTTRQERLLQHAGARVDNAGQRQAKEPRLVATTRGNQVPGAEYSAGAKGGLIYREPDGSTRANAGKGTNAAGGGGITDPGTIARRLDVIRAVAAPPMTFGHCDALELVEEWLPRLGARARVVLDPPYNGKTGYPATCPRERVLRIAEVCARHRAPTVINEAESLREDLGAGWSSALLRQTPKPEWVTTWGCQISSIAPPLLRWMCA